MKHYLLGMLVLLLLVLVVPVATAQDDETIAGKLMTAAEADEPQFTILLQLVTAAELEDTLADKEAQLTVFAPTDAAFDALLEKLDLSLEELLDAPDNVMSILLYHAAEGVFTAEDLADMDTIATLQGGEISVSMNEDDEIVLDEVATVVDAEIEASNGIIHVIDNVLMPLEGMSIVFGDAEPCLVSTTQTDTVRVRVGPGTNRTSVSYLPANQEFEPLGQAEDSDGNTWFQLDKEQAAPGRAINEAWVAAADLDITGDCSAVGESAPPPIIPIISSSSSSGGGIEIHSASATSTDGSAVSVTSSSGTPPDTTTSSGDSSNTTAPPASSGGAFPASGSWVFTFADFTNASCSGVPNQVIPSRDLYDQMSYTSRITPSGNNFLFDGVLMSDIGNNTYRGQLTVGGVVGTIFIQPASAFFMTGTFNVSIQNCSAGTAFTMAHN